MSGAPGDPCEVCGAIAGEWCAPTCSECPPKEVPSYDWKDVSVALAASNARLCEIALKADELALEVERSLEVMFNQRRRDLVRAAIDAYKIARNGQ